MKLIVFLYSLVQLNRLSGGSEICSRKRPAGRDGCCISIKDDLPVKDVPFLLNTKNNLVVPQNISNDLVISLEEGDAIELVCPGKRNAVKQFNSPRVKINCKSGIDFINDRTKYNITSLGCLRKINPEIKNTQKSCASNKGTLLQIGFQGGSNSARDWHSLIDVCHNIESGLTYYSKHDLAGSLIKGKMSSPNNTRFVNDENWLFKGYNEDVAYKKANQKKIFQDLLGSVSNEYIDPNSRSTKFLARGHLAPAADFIFQPFQAITYHYVNVAPQWQSINAGIWKSLEFTIKKLNKNLNIATGTHGILTLKDDTNRENEIYLERDKKLPVPKFFWKVIRNKQDNSCMAFVVSNEPYTTKSISVCDDICTKHNWPVISSDEGRIICCDYDELKNTITDIPTFNCKKLLKY